MISPTVITAPVKEPVSVAEAKLQCRVDGDTEDTLFAIYIAAARAYYERRTSRTIHQTTYEYTLDAFPDEGYIVLPRATPLISVTSVKYKDSDGSETTMSTSDYIVDTDSTPGRVVLAYGESWPSFTEYPANAVRIRYVAGIETKSPETEADSLVKIPILMLVAAMYENREAVVVADAASVSQLAVEYGVEAFISANLAEFVC